MGEAVAIASESRAPDFEIRRFSPESYVAYWPHIEKELDRISHVWSSHWTKESLYEGVMNGSFQVWGFGTPTTIKMVVYTHIAEFPAARILQVFLAFGNSLDSMLPFMEASLERFVREIGCQACEITAREGWVRKLPKFRKTGVVLRREFANYGVH